MKLNFTNRQQLKQKMKMGARLVVAAAVFAFTATVLTLSILLNIIDVRSMLAQGNMGDKYWVGKAIYVNAFNNQWEVNSWALKDDNGSGSLVLAGDGTAILTMDNAAGGYANKLESTYDGAPILLTLDKVNGRLDLNVNGLTGGRQQFWVEAEQYDANNNYISNITVMFPAAYCGYFVSYFNEFTWAANATKVRFVINGQNMSSQQGTIKMNHFCYYNGNNDWKNPQNWGTASAGTGGEACPESMENAIFDGGYTSNCNINGSLNVGGVNITSSYNGIIFQNANTITIGSNGFTQVGGTFQGGSGDITVNGPFVLNHTSAVYRAPSADLTLNGDFTFTAGTFQHNNGTVILGNTMTWTGNTNLFNLSASSNGSTKTYTIAGTTQISVANDFRLGGNATMFLNGTGRINARGNLYSDNKGMWGGGTAQLAINGTAAQLLKGNNTIGMGAMPIVVVDKASGTMTMDDTISVGGGWTYVKGTVNSTNNNSTVAFGGTNMNVNGGATTASSMRFDNVVFYKAFTTTTTGTLLAEGRMTLLDSSRVDIGGFDVDVKEPSLIQGTIAFTNTAGTKLFNDLVVDTTGTWNCSAIDELFTISGHLENYGNFMAAQTAGVSYSTNTLYSLTGVNKNIKGNITLTRVDIDNPSNTASYTNHNYLDILESINGAGGTLIQNPAAYLYIGVRNNPADYTLTTLNATAIGNHVNYNRSRNAEAQDVLATTYFNIIFSGEGKKNQRGNITVLGSLNIQDEGYLDATTANFQINLKGDWLNEGLGTNDQPFTARAGTVLLTGTGTQTVSSTNYAGGNKFNNLTFNNTATTIPQIVFANNDNATGTLSFTSGHVSLGTNTFTLGTSATATGTLAHTSGLIISGTLKRFLNTTAIAQAGIAGTFPMGYYTGSGTSVSNRMAYVSGQATTGGSVSVSHNHVNGTFDYPLPFSDGSQLIDVRHNMNWVMSSGDGLAGTNFALRLRAQDIPGVNDATQLRIVLQTGVAPGTSTAGTGTVADPGANKSLLSASGFNNTFYIGSAWNTNPLPIKLISFTAKEDGDRVKLDWVTASEENNDYFTVERSKDGLNFESVLNKPGAGNSNSNLYYSDYDNNPYTGLSYYRLKQTDFNGAFTYSPIEAVEFKGNKPTFDFTVFPNPASASFGDDIQVSAETEGLEGERIVYTMVDMSGKIVATQDVKGNGSTLVLSIGNASAYKPGTYIVVATVGKERISKKIIVQ